MVIPTATVSNSQNYKSDIDEVDIRRLNHNLWRQHSTFNIRREPGIRFGREIRQPSRLIRPHPTRPLAHSLGKKPQGNRRMTVGRVVQAQT